MADLARLVALHRQPSTPENAREIVSLDDKLFGYAHPHQPRNYITEREQVILDCWADGMTMADIGHRHGISGTRVSQIIQLAKQKLAGRNQQRRDRRRAAS